MPPGSMVQKRNGARPVQMASNVLLAGVSNGRNQSFSAGTMLTEDSAKSEQGVRRLEEVQERDERMIRKREIGRDSGYI